MRSRLCCHAASLIGRDAEWLEPRPLLKAGLYWPGETITNLADLQAGIGRPASRSRRSCSIAR